MESLTLCIALILSALVLFLPANLALVIYVTGLTWYPIYITAKLGALDFSIPRIVILAIFLKIAMDRNCRSRFRWIKLDYLVIIAAVSAFVSNLFLVPLEEMLEFHAGLQFDTLLVYFMVRLLVFSRKMYLPFLKGLLIIASPMAVLGVYQCVSFVNPFGFFKYYHAWAVVEKFIQVRENFCRAELTFSHPIMFGMFFAMIGPWCLGLWHFIKPYWRPMLVLGMVLMFLGLVSSMSSGPQLAGVGAVLAFVLFPFRRYWKAYLGIFVLMMAAVELISNRHWYYVCSSYLAFNAQTAYGRCKLIEHALGGGMSGHWILGFGFEDPGWWAALQGSERKGTDITNHYIVLLVQYGLVGFIPFMVTVYEACKCLRKSFVAAVNDAERWLIWCLVASMTGILLSMLSVSMMGQMNNLFYMLLGLCGAHSEMISRPISSVIVQPSYAYGSRPKSLYLTA